MRFRRRRAAAQGALGTVHALATAAGAVIGGVLFSWGVAPPFVGGGAVSLGLILLAIPFFRAAGEPRVRLAGAGRIG